MANRPDVVACSMTHRGARSSPWSRPFRSLAIHEVVHWRLIDLAQWVFDEYALSVSKQILSGEMRAAGYRKLLGHDRAITSMTR